MTIHCGTNKYFGYSVERATNGILPKRHHIQVDLHRRHITMAEKLLPPEHPHLKEYRETLARCRAALAEQGKPDAKGGGG